MPVFEFVCDCCDTRRDVFVRGMGESLVHCEKCGEIMRKQLSAPAVIFKGSGFYTTDYGRGQAAREAAKMEECGQTEEKKKESSTAASSATQTSVSGKERAEEADSGKSRKIVSISRKNRTSSSPAAKRARSRRGRE